MSEWARVAFVRRVAQHLSSGQVTMDWARRNLGVSQPPRRRHPQEENVTVSAIVEAVRRELAESGLRDRPGRRNLGEIAFRLGF